MADKVTDKQVSDLLEMLRSDSTIDAKVNQVNIVKTGIKHNNVPDHLVMPLFDALRLASSAQHAVLVNAGFTALNHLLARLSRQEPKYLIKETARSLPVIIEKLGDPKDKLRALASQSLTTLYHANATDVERSVRNLAMAGKNARAKEASMQWLLLMHQEYSIQFKLYVPSLIELLEDADPTVREVAKTTVIELFKNAPNPAKSDLKRQMKIANVRPAIEQAITKELAPQPGSTGPDTPIDTAPVTRPPLAASVSSLMSERPNTPMLSETKAESVDPAYVNTQRELDDIFKEMQPYFEGRETEQNWFKREESVTKLRKLLAGNAPSDFPDHMLAGLKSMLDGILKAVNSLRTSLSKEGCTLVQDIAVTFGPAMDSMVELLMQTFIKLTAATKKISSQLANTTVDTIIGRVTFNNRIMQHIWGACQDKNVQPRLYATGWLKTLLTKEARHKSHVEHTGSLDLIEKSIHKGLNDANPGVREKMRSTYWCFAAIWPARAEIMMDSLDATAQKLLQKHSDNPNSPKKAETGARPGLGLSKSTMTASKPTLRETMLAQKKAALAAKNLPARPGSAMSSFTPVRNVSNSSTVSAVSAATTTIVTKMAGRPRPETTFSVGSGSMSGAPLRPSKKRVDTITRPATAGPYSVRTFDGSSRENTSPSESTKSKTTTPRTATTASPRRTAPKMRPGHATHASESSLPSPTRSQAAKGSATPKKQAINSSSPTKANEELTLVVPTLATLKAPMAEEESPLPTQPLAESLDETKTEAPTLTLKVYEDPFVDEQPTTRPTFTGSVLEDRPINEDAAVLANNNNIIRAEETVGVKGPESPSRARQDSRLLDSGITRIKAKTLDVHGFRKLQSLIRDSTATFTDEKFNALLLGLFEYLEASLTNLAPERVQDVKAQVLATIRLLLKKERENFRPHISRGLECLLRTRNAYDGRTHIVSGLELLADELVMLGDASEIVITMTRALERYDDSTVEGARSLTMGMHVLRELLDKQADYIPSDVELTILAGLASRCIGSGESAVRRDAVQLCVSLHTKAGGDARFWQALRGFEDDPRSLITYYIVQRQREREGLAA